MKAITAIALLMLASCADMTPAQKRWTTIGASVLIVGAVAAHRGSSIGNRQDKTIQPVNCQSISCQ